MQQAISNFHPVTDFKAGLFNTHTGKTISFKSPSIDQIDIGDIGSALSKICRFGGHSNSFYSVAQHSILVSHLVPSVIRREALLHDAAEAYTGDVIKPLKELLGFRYKTVEKRFERLIADKFELTVSKNIKELIKKADNEALKMEHEAFIMGKPGNLHNAMFKAEMIIDVGFAWDCYTAQYRFSEAYKNIFGGK